jgi:hypothetical protein
LEDRGSLFNRLYKTYESLSLLTHNAELSVKNDPKRQSILPDEINELYKIKDMFNNVLGQMIQRFTKETSPNEFPTLDSKGEII